MPRYYTYIPSERGEPRSPPRKPASRYYTYVPAGATRVRSATPSPNRAFKHYTYVPTDAHRPQSPDPPPATKYYTYVPAPARRAPTPPPKPEAYYNYAVENAGRLTSALPKFVYVDGHHVRTPNVPKEYVSIAETPQAAQAPVVYQNYSPMQYQPVHQYIHAAPKPVAAAASSDHAYWYGSTREEVDVQNQAIYAATARPTPVIPYEPSSDQQFWCRELDGSYTLRTMTECMESLQPGHWKQGAADYPYFVRTK